MDTSLIGELRALTGAGMMDIKKALDEAQGNKEKALEILEKLGALKAAKKADRATDEGVIGSYVHAHGKVAVLVELMCETDFVARNEQFTTLAHDLAMHIAAFSPRYTSKQQVPAEIIAHEREKYSAELLGTPDGNIEKIIEEKLANFYDEVCLLNQKFLKDNSQTVREYIQSKAHIIGENIQVRRFCRIEINGIANLCQ